MNELIPDPRIVGIENVDRSKCVLSDAHSMSVIANVLSSDEIPNFSHEVFANERGGDSLAHVIQSVVLYEHILVDSVLFDLGVVNQAEALFPEIIKGLFLRPSVRNAVAESMDYSDINGDLHDWILPENLRIRWDWLDSSEKGDLDNIDGRAPSLIPPEYIRDKELERYYQREKPLHCIFPDSVLNSNMTVARAWFYLELSRKLGIPMNIDPIRSAFLRNHTNCIDPIAAALTEEFIEKVTDINGPIAFDVTIPPIPEFVLAFAKRERISLHEATMRVRDSKNARAFREWCGRLFQARARGYSSLQEFKDMLASFKNACAAWTLHIGEGVEHRTRKLCLGDLPWGIGTLLKAVGMDTREVRDPILYNLGEKESSEYRYFLFLNDLISPATGSE